jgi:hypothetical protein
MFNANGEAMNLLKLIKDAKNSLPAMEKRIQEQEVILRELDEEIDTLETGKLYYKRKWVFN